MSTKDLSHRETEVVKLLADGMSYKDIANHLNGGYSDGTFRPYNNVTRGQMAKFNANAAGYSDDVTGRQTFSDVPSTQTFYAFIERLEMRDALEEIPLNVPYRPGCNTPGVQPCYRPDYESTRSDAVQLIFLAYNTSAAYGQPGGPVGQAFPRRLTESN